MQHWYINSMSIYRPTINNEEVRKLHPDIEKAIAHIDEKIKELRTAKATLIDAFGSSNQSLPLSQRDQPLGLRPFGLPSEGTRKEKGPLTRGEIKSHLPHDFPEGSISFALNDKDLFVNKDGKWHLTDAIKKS
jgi:hypothetical protein